MIINVRQFNCYALEALASGEIIPHPTEVPSAQCPEPRALVRSYPSGGEHSRHLFNSTKQELMHVGYLTEKDSKNESSINCG